MRSWMKETRESKGMTMKEVGEKLGISESYYSMIERGERQQKLDITLVSKLSAIFEVSLQYIVEQEGQHA